MWTQCNVAFKIHLLIHFSNCKTCSSQCLSPVSELHSVRKRWFCILKLHKIRVYCQNFFLWFLIFCQLKIETLLDCRPTLGSWRHCACITLKESLLFVLLWRSRLLGNLSAILKNSERRVKKPTNILPTQNCMFQNPQVPRLDSVTVSLFLFFFIWCDK